MIIVERAIRSSLFSLFYLKLYTLIHAEIENIEEAIISERKNLIYHCVVVFDFTTHVMHVFHPQNKLLFNVNLNMMALC